MARALKSREGDHFHIAVGPAAQLEAYVPEIPDWANDQQTIAGNRLGRGLGYFREILTQHVPPPVSVDPYEDEAYRLLAIRLSRKQDNPQTRELDFGVPP